MIFPQREAAYPDMLVKEILISFPIQRAAEYFGVKPSNQISN